MKLKLICLISIFLFQAGCCNYDIKALENRILSLENRHISSETAILIAKGEMRSQIKLQNFDISVKEGIDIWEIHFSSKCKDCQDGQPYVVINKVTGETVRVYHYGEPVFR